MSNRRSLTACAFVLLAGVLNWIALPVLGEKGVASAEANVESNLAPGAEKPSKIEAGSDRHARLSEAYGKLPLGFEANQGQFGPRVKFVSRSGGHMLFLTSNEAVLRLYALTRTTGEEKPVAIPANSRRKKAEQESIKVSSLRMKLIGARAARTAGGLNELSGETNHFIGNDPKKWRSGVKTYSAVRYASVYPGIDLVYHGEQGRLEYDFRLAPGAVPERITLAFHGAEKVRIDAGGDLVLTVAGIEVRQRKPVVFQEFDRNKREIDGRFVMRGRGRVGFKVGPYDSRRPLVIDPILDYSTYLGGGGEDQGFSIAVDSAGSAYVTGLAGSLDFPTVNPLQPAPRNIFIAKLNPSGTALVYSTYLGGTNGGLELSRGIAVDSTGNVYITGRTFATNFPTMNPLQSINKGSGDVFVVKLNPTGSALIYSTYLGGIRNDFGYSIAADSDGNAYVTGETSSSDFPTANAFQPSRAGSRDAFATKINTAGSAFIYSTFFGGVSEDFGAGIAVDSTGNAYLTGGTQSLDFPTMAPLQPAFGGRTIFNSTNQGGNWNIINNGVPNNGWVNSIAIDPRSTSTMYAGAVPGGIFRSTDAGGSWAAINTGIPAAGDLTTALVVDPTDSSKLYAALSFFGAFTSTDTGASWSKIFDTPTNALVIDPQTPTTLYLSDIFGVQRSTNSGKTWQESFFINAHPFIACLAVDPATTSTIYAGGSNISEVYKSTDGGVSFGSINSPFTFSVDAIAIDPITTSTIYAWSRGLFKSTDGGSNWASMSNGLGPELLANSIAVDPVTPSTVYIGTSRGLFQSTDAGANWQVLNGGLPNANIAAIAIDPINSAKVYAGAVDSFDGFIARFSPSGAALGYSTYLGGLADDAGAGIAVDSSGNAYVTGGVISSDFPTANALQPAFAGAADTFVTKVNASGSALTFSTYVGGSELDQGNGIAVDSSGNVYVTGFTQSANFPMVNALQASYGGVEDAFVIKVDASGSALAFSTYLGGSGGDNATGIAADSSGSVYVTGLTASTNYPTTTGSFQTDIAGSLDAFISRIDASPTAVKLSSFKALGYDEGVYLKWQTGLETDNLGFNIYREVGGTRALVNPELVAGSALRAGVTTKLQAGQSYAWWDREISECGGRIADCRAAQYWLEEIDLNGTRTMHGPFSVLRVGGERPRESQADLLSSLGKGKPRTGQIPLTDAAAHSGSSEAKFAMSSADASPKPGSSPAIKIAITEEGWYRITQQELVAAGFDSKGDPRRLQVRLGGTEHAIFVRGEQDGSFDPGDAIEFFATGRDSAFTDSHVYWLVSGARPGKRIDTLASKKSAGGLRSFPYTAERRDRTTYFSSLKNGDAENFFGAVIAGQPLDQTVTISHLDMKSAAPAALEIALQGVTDIRGAAPDHQVRVRLNGTDIGKLIFDGQANKVEKLAVKSALLMEGDNLVSLVSEAGAGDISLVSYIRLTYPHTFTGDQDSLRMTVPSGGSQTIAGFTNPSIRVVDITDSAEVRELTGPTQRLGESYAVTVNVPGRGLRTLLAFTENRVRRPAAIQLDQPSSLRDASNQAEFLIVTRREFFALLEPLKTLRENQRFRVALVDIADIYDEFSYGEKTPQAVKDFIVYAATNWNGKPSFVLFAGDASLDPRNYLGFGDRDVVPTKLVDTSLMEAASDDWFADFNDDGLAELAVGRLPLLDANDAATAVFKIISYEASRPATEVLLVADRNDEFDFEFASMQIQELIPSGLRVNQLNRTGVEASKAKAQLIEAIARGQKIVNYVGHGSSNQWNDGLLTNEIARSLTNGDRLPLFVMMTCLNGYFHDASADSLAESLLKSEHGGAVAVWASSGVSSPNSQTVIDRELYRAVFDAGKNLTLGEAVMRAKSAASDPDVRKTWVLLGDPTMRLK